MGKGLPIRRRLADARESRIEVENSQNLLFAPVRLSVNKFN